MSPTVKGQLNTPRDFSGNEMPILQPGRGYSILDLRHHARQVGFVYPFPDRDDPHSFPYWETYPTAKECPEVLVAKSGMVAVSYRRDDQYTILTQQWSHQAPKIDAQKYLQVWMATNPLVLDSSAHNLHRLVARTHCEITADCVYRDWQGNLRVKPGVQVDHADCNKANNSFYNLTLISKEANQRLIYCLPADKDKELARIRGATIDPDMICWE